MGQLLAKLLDKYLGTFLCYGLAGWQMLTPNKKQHDPRKSKRILIEKLIAIGDVIVALPTIHSIRLSFPDAYIVLLVTPRVKAVVEGNPDVNEIIYYDVFGQDKGLRGFLRAARNIRKKKFDLVLELTHYHRIVSLLTFWSGIKQRAGFAIAGQGRNKLLTIPVRYDIQKHEVEAFLDVAKAVGAETIVPELQPIPFSHYDQISVDKLAQEIGVGPEMVLLQPGTSGIALSRRWENSKWAAVANWLNQQKKQVVFCGSNEEEPLFQEIRKQLDFEPLSVIGKLSLKQLACFVQKAKLYIGLDTGTTHLAAAMGTRVLALYGPNTPFKWGPYGRQHRVIYKGLACSPCTKQYLGQVSKCQDNKCMQIILAEEVIKALQEVFLL
ncbi:MAG: glycosyltransferase family 9 protein [Candidatus Margulisiibacteriota bacterium]|jgi:lipopolysaccharide heptosyltransferase II